MSRGFLTRGRTSDIAASLASRHQVRFNERNTDESEAENADLMSQFRILMTACVLASAAWTFTSASSAAEIDFNREVRPILSDSCFSCHGFDKAARKADLRLDTLEGATADREGSAAIVPGKPELSLLIERVSSTDPDLVMPPAGSHRKPLKIKDVEILREWIRQGAVWGKHWAFEPPVKAATPENGPHPIDFFIRKRLSAEQLTPAERAAVHTLVRRLSFDLTGLPPDPEVVERLVKDHSPEAWEKLTDQLLASPHFGERMAMWWLDGARYSDTDGFQSDATRTNWPWRDWVVASFNSNMPFDQFTIEQFAGDLLPNATPEQRLATCFHRNHMTNGEGGRDKEESRIDYVLDRTNTMGTLWLGLTLGCTQCHDHKFDPVSQRDYYSLTAYFDSIDETGAAGSGAAPFMKYRSPYAKRAVEEAEATLKESDAVLARVRARAEADFVPWLEKQIEKTRSGFQPWAIVKPVRLATTGGYVLSADADGIIRSEPAEFPQDDFIVTASPSGLSRITGMRLEVFPHASHTDGKYSFSPSGEFILTNLKLLVQRRGTSQYREIAVASAAADIEGEGEDKGYGKIAGTLDDDPRKGWTTRTKPGDVTHTAVFALAEPLVLAEDEELRIVLMQRSLAPRELIGRFRVSLTNQPGVAARLSEKMPLEELAEAAASEGNLLSAANLDAKLRGRLFEQFLEDHSEWNETKSRNNRIRGQLSAAKSAAGDVSVMVLGERKDARTSHILERGVWDKKGEDVTRGVLPAVLAVDPSQVTTRLELAKWIASRENPLTARVITNQIWQLLFGAGLVRTPNDFGLQGESPTHPQLLDWLAVDFMENGWDVKHLVKTIVLSEAYRQDSSATKKLLELDLENRLLARGPRYRLPAWMIRDSLLKSSGLLNSAVGGPPVFPYQPPGVWQDQFMGRFTYVPTLGPGQYRRTLYAFWRRSSAPTFLFDSAMRRTCEVAPRLTNTPLHALTLLNDLTSQEAMRSLADASFKDAPQKPEARIEFLFRRALSRPPETREREILRREYDRALKFYQAHREQAHTFASPGQVPEPANDHLPELAATMLLANLVLNLDEAITHE